MLVRITILPALVLLCDIGAVASTLTQLQKNSLLLAHNRARSTPSPKPCWPLIPMTWSAALERVAQTFADTCTYGNNHDRARAAAALGSFATVGENVHTRTNALNGRRIAEAVQAIDRGRASYDAENNICAQHHHHECLQYTQIVWNASTAVGCGAKLCDATKAGGLPATWTARTAYIVVCNYGPAGNVAGERPYKATACNVTQASGPGTKTGEGSLNSAGSRSSPGSRGNSSVSPSDSPGFQQESEAAVSVRHCSMLVAVVCAAVTLSV
ncbi:peptidase inhibitor 16-like [Sycon ciliatum]|uniref:peptidase inhibitor 16-like n=1 Tax=Sycon ciliatum TaxID=27933 RepID=UPI0031F6E397